MAEATGTPAPLLAAVDCCLAAAAVAAATVSRRMIWPSDMSAERRSPSDADNEGERPSAASAPATADKGAGSGRRAGRDRGSGKPAAEVVAKRTAAVETAADAEGMEWLRMWCAGGQARWAAMAALVDDTVIAGAAGGGASP